MDTQPSTPAPMNRYLVVFGAVLIQLCLGSIYAWSVFTKILTEEPYGFREDQTQILFGVELAVFALVMIFAGRLMKKIPPRFVAALGGAVLGVGYVLAGFMQTSFIGHLICIGLIGGAGIGLGYAVPIAVGVKWFPDKKGMLTGLAVAGFGFGSLIWVKLAGDWGGLLENIGLANTFIAYGISFAAIVLIGSVWMIEPPEDYRPPGWVPPEAQVGSPAGIELDAGQMLRRWQFFAIWGMFAAGAMAGLMVIGCIKLFGIDALRNSGVSEDRAGAIAGTAMGVFFALANGLGRIGWGVISDRIGRRASLALMFAAQGVAMLLFYSMGSIEYLFYLAAAIVGFNFGGNFALFPAMTADYFGSKNVGSNYAWVFTSFGVGGIVGPVLGGYFRSQATEGDPSVWLTPFVIAGIACLVAAAVAIALRPPQE